MGYTISFFIIPPQIQSEVSFEETPSLWLSDQSFHIIVRMQSFTHTENIYSQAELPSQWKFEVRRQSRDSSFLSFVSSLPLVFVLCSTTTHFLGFSVYARALQAVSAKKCFVFFSFFPHTHSCMTKNIAKYVGVFCDLKSYTIPTIPCTTKLKCHGSFRKLEIKTTFKFSFGQEFDAKQNQPDEMHKLNWNDGISLF